MSALADLQPHVDISIAWRRKMANAELYSIPNTHTRYGTVCVTRQLNGKNGPLDVYYASPFAVLDYACRNYQNYFDLLESIIAEHGEIDVVFYLDRATPGNTRRPDPARTMQCIYWTIVQMPAWWLSRRNGWCPYGYILVKSQQDFGVTDSMIVRFFCIRSGWHQTTLRLSTASSCKA